MKAKLIAIPYKAITVSRKIRDNEVLQNVKNFQLDIQKVAGLDHKYHSRAELHITVFEQINKYSKFVTYRTPEEALELTQIATEHQKPFSICFNEYRLVSSGVILYSHDSGELNRIRQDVIDTSIEWGIVDRNITKYPDIAHSTVVRWKKPLLEEQQKEVAKIIKKYNSHFIGSEKVTGLDVRESTIPLDYSSGINKYYVGLGE